MIKSNSIKNTRKHFTNVTKSSNGFTLIEMLATIFIFTILMAGIGALFKNVFVSSVQQNKAIRGIDQARKVTRDFTNELRNGITGNNGSYPINQAGNSEIIFYSNYGTSGSNVNRIRYYLSNQSLYKGVVTPSGNPPTYNIASEVIRPVQTGVINGGTPIFYYYPDTFGGTTTALSQPVNVNQVKFVEMNLNVLKQNGSATSSSFTVSAGTTIRNLKSNLGN